MKKIFKLFVFALLIFTFSISSVLAEEAKPEQGSIIATVNIYNAEITSQENNVFDISFDISNREMVQTGVMYGVSLIKNSSKGQTIVDQKIYDDSLTLAENTTINKKITYTAPVILDGDYTLLLTSRNESGLTLALSSLGTVSLTSSIKGVEVLPETCSVSVVGETGGKTYTLNQGVDIASDESLKLTCKLKNTDSKSIEVTPSFETHYRDVYGKKVMDEGGDMTPTTLKSLETKEVSFVLPKAREPQAYDVIMSLKYGDNTSNGVVVHYVLQGVSATIQNVSLDKDSYNKGDQATLSLFWSGSADNFPGSRASSDQAEVNLLASISSGSRKCSPELNQTLDKNESLVKIPFTITSNCVDPQIALTLKDQNGKILDQKTFNVESASDTTQNTENPASNKTVAIIIIVLIILIIIGFILKKKKGDSSIPMGVLFFIFTLITIGSFMPVNNVNADTYSYDGADYTFNIDKDTYALGENIIASGYTTYTVCGNPNNHVYMIATGEKNSVTLRIIGVIIGKWASGTLLAPDNPGDYMVKFEMIDGYGYEAYTFYIPYTVLAPAPTPTISVKVLKSGESVPSSKTTVNQGETATIIWYATGLDVSKAKCYRSDTQDEMAYSEIPVSFDVQPSETTTYTIVCNDGGKTPTNTRRFD